MPVVTPRTKGSKKVIFTKQERHSDDDDATSEEEEMVSSSDDDDYARVIAGLTVTDIMLGVKTGKTKNAAWSVADKTFVVREGVRAKFTGACLPTPRETLRLLAHWDIPFPALGRRGTTIVLQKLVAMVVSTLSESTMCRLLRTTHKSDVTIVKIAGALDTAVKDEQFSFAWFKNYTSDGLSTMDRMHEEHERGFWSWTKPPALGETALIKATMELLCKQQAFQQHQSTPSPLLHHYRPSPYQAVYSIPQTPVSAVHMLPHTQSEAQHLDFLRFALELAATAKAQPSPEAAAPYLRQIAEMKARNGGHWQKN